MKEVKNILFFKKGVSKMENKIGYVDDKGQVWESWIQPTFESKREVEVQLTYKVCIPDQITEEQEAGYIRWKCASGCDDSCALIGFQSVKA